MFGWKRGDFFRFVIFFVVALAVCSYCCDRYFCMRLSVNYNSTIYGLLNRVYDIASLGLVIALGSRCGQVCSRGGVESQYGFAGVGDNFEFKIILDRRLISHGSNRLS